MSDTRDDWDDQRVCDGKMVSGKVRRKVGQVMVLMFGRWKSHTRRRYKLTKIQVRWTIEMRTVTVMGILNVSLETEMNESYQKVMEENMSWDTLHVFKLLRKVTSSNIDNLQKPKMQKLWKPFFGRTNRIYKQFNITKSLKSSHLWNILVINFG